VDELRGLGVRAGLFRPVTLFPFPAAELNRAAHAGRVLVVELSNGQYRDDVLLHLDRERGQRVGLVNRMGGNMMRVEDVTQAALAMMGARA